MTTRCCGRRDFWLFRGSLGRSRTGDNSVMGGMEALVDESGCLLKDLYRYMELTDTKEFFDIAKKSERMVVHFFRGTTPRCEIVDAHLDRLAPAHLETRFVKINAEKNPFLVERLRIVMLPTLVLIRSGHTEHSIVGFDEMGGVDDFSTDDLAHVLAGHKMLFFSGDRSEEIRGNASRAGMNSIRLNNIRGSAYSADYDDDDV